MNSSTPLTKVFVTFPWSFLSSIQVFFDFEIIFSFLTIQGLLISTIQKSASFPIDKFPLSILRTLAGLLVNNFIIFGNLIELLWKSSKESGSSVSMPEAPVAACENVSLFDSSSSGLWSDTKTSIKSLLIPLIRDCLSSSVLKGGDNFKNVLKSPISFSFKERLLIETPVVKSIWSFFF